MHLFRNFALFKAENEINLLPGFTVEPGAEFLARIAPCTRTPLPQINLITKNADVFLPITPIADTNMVYYGEVIPNPNHGEFKLKTDIEENTVFDIKIINLNGKVLESYSSININDYVFNLKHLPPGLYLATLHQLNKYLTIKIIIK